MNSDAFVPPIAMAVTVRGPVPVLLSVTVAVLLSLRVTLPIARGEGATPATGFVPVPLSVVDCGLPGASSATFTVAVLAPVAPGVNVTLITHEPPLAVSTKFATQVVPEAIAKSPAFVPVIVTGAPAVSVAANVPEFVTVIVCAVLVVATF